MTCSITDATWEGPRESTSRWSGRVTFSQFADGLVLGLQRDETALSQPSDRLAGPLTSAAVRAALPNHSIKSLGRPCLLERKEVVYSKVRA